MKERTLLKLYELMYRSRFMEETITRLWNDGHIYGEMHLGIGEEAIIAGVLSHLIPGDAIATDHRSTAPFVMRGVDLEALLLEILGHPKGLCLGMGGHMHLFSQELLLTSSGIVGSSGPSAVGFALAAKYRKTNNIAVAFFGEGSMNQGMLLESLNLAAAMSLPVLFVCKDNNWAITTQSSEVTGGVLLDRVRGFGIEAREIDGSDVTTVWQAVETAIPRMRKSTKSPYFIQAHCTHNEGHFLGDPLLRFHRAPRKEFGAVTGPLMKSVLQYKGGRIDKRIGSVTKVLSLIAKSRMQLSDSKDPLLRFEKDNRDLEDQFTQIKSSIQSETNLLVERIMGIIQEEGVL
ncbi:MAG: thiamine pyrophosphate-dependent dehydrogenase E1 component subunit alpha [Candidatus Hodarchaeales archaeon]|jgi:pyruvate dehydrogenase E1 component alpha subunit